MTNIINSWKYLFVIPHLIVYFIMSQDKKEHVLDDVSEMNRRCGLHKKLTYYLVNRKPYRNLFYYRVGRVSKFLKLFLPRYSFFYIGGIDYFGGAAFVLNHPYGTIINAKKIGRNFTICQLTTVGNKEHGRNDLIPTIGDNVSLGANVSIIGGITIGNNVIVGAGSVVVKNVPDNCVVAGNPAKVIKYL